MSEINRKIAQLRGWQLIFDDTTLPGFCRIIEPDGRQISNIDNGHPTNWFAGGDIDRALPNYEHDLSTAWLLFLELPSGIITPSTVSYDTGDIVKSFKAVGHTPQAMAAAICEAWLEVKNK